MARGTRSCVAASILAGIAALTAGCPEQPVAPPRVGLTIQNATGVPLCDVMLRPSSHVAAGWGSDWLDRDEHVAPGLERTFQLPPGETWDLELRDCAGLPVHQRLGVHVTAPAVVTVTR